MLAFTAALLGCPRPGPAVPVVVDTAALGGADVHWYDVGGHDVVSLRESLRAEGPLNERGEHVNGETTWALAWRWSGDGEPCAVSTLALDLSLVVALPRWTPAPGTDPALVANWRRYLDALVVHEGGHARLVLRGRDWMEVQLRTVPCVEVDAAGREILAAIHAQNAEYDRETGHGATQGARFWTAPEWGVDLDQGAPFAP